MNDELLLPDKSSDTGVLNDPRIAVKPEDNQLVLPDKNPLEDNYFEAIRVNPDRAAEIFQLANTFNQHPNDIEANFDDVKALSQVPSREYWDNIQRDYPATADFLSDKYNMALARDHTNLLTDLEKTYQNMNYGLNTWQTQRDMYDVLAAQRANVNKTGVRNVAMDARLQAIEEKLASRKDPGGGLSVPYIFNAYQFGSQIPFTLGALWTGQQYGVAAAIPTAIVGGGVGLATAGPAGVVPGAITWGLQGYSKGSWVGMTKYSYDMEGTYAWGELSKLKDKNGKPLPPEAVELAAKTVGGINAAIETVSLGIVTAPFRGVISRAALPMIAQVPGSSAIMGILTKTPEAFAGMTIRQAIIAAAKQALLTQYTETQEEYFQEVVPAIAKRQLQLKYGANEPIKTYPQILTESTSVIRPVSEGMLPMSLLGGGTQFYLASTQIAQMDQQAEASIKNLSDVETATQAMNLKKRDPVAYESFIKKLTEGTANENTYIPVDAFEAYFQSKKIDPIQAADDLGVKEQYVEAKAAGSDVVIPTSTFIVKAGGTEHFMGLAEDVRPGPDMATPRENREAAALASKAIEEQLKELDKEVAGDVTVKEARDKIYQDVKDQLDRPEIYPGMNPKQRASLIDQNARVTAALVVQAAKRKGISIEEHYNELRPMILGETPIKAPNDTLGRRMRASLPKGAKIYIPGDVRADWSDVINKYPGLFTHQRFDRSGVAFSSADEVAESLGLDENALREQLRAEQVRPAAMDDYEKFLEMDYYTGLHNKMMAELGKMSAEEIDALLANPDALDSVLLFYNEGGDAEKTRALLMDVLDEIKRQQTVSEPVMQRSVEAPEVMLGSALGPNLSEAMGDVTAVDMQFVEQDLKKTRQAAQDAVSRLEEEAKLGDKHSKATAERRLPEARAFLEEINRRTPEEHRAVLENFRELYQAPVPRRGIKDVYDLVLSGHQAWPNELDSYTKEEWTKIQNENPGYGAELIRKVVNRNPAILYQSPVGLMGMHNLTADKLIHADKMGGLAVPSLAVVKHEFPITSYGEITLLAPRDLVDPKTRSNKVFSSDVYSPRYPRVTYFFSDKAGDVLQPIIDKVKKNYKVSKKSNLMYHQESNDWHSVFGSFDSNGRQELSGSKIIMLGFLLDHGIKNLKDWSAMKDAIKARQDEFDSYVDEIYGKVLKEEKIFKGYTYLGNRQYKAHTLENVVKELKGEIRDAEGFNYGLGSLRANVSRQYRSLAQMREDFHRILSDAEFEKVKVSFQKEFDDIISEAYKKYDQKADLGVGDIFLNVLKDGIRRGDIKAELDEYHFPGMDIDRINDFLAKIQEMPTGYFEAKIQRAVRLNEFAGAVIPKSSTKQVRDVLKKNGILFIEYDDSPTNAPGTFFTAKENQQKAVQEFANKLHAKNNNILFQSAVPKYTKGKNLVNALYEAPFVVAPEDFKTELGQPMARAYKAIFDYQFTKTPLNNRFLSAGLKKHTLFAVNVLKSKLSGKDVKALMRRDYVADGRIKSIMESIENFIETVDSNSPDQVAVDMSQIKQALHTTLTDLPELNQMLGNPWNDFAALSDLDNVLYQMPVGFYSTLQRTLETKMPNMATPQQIRGIISTLKPEEVKWSGIEEFLQGKETEKYLECANCKAEKAINPNLDIELQKKEFLKEHKTRIGRTYCAMVYVGVHERTVSAKISKQELLDYLKGNELEIKEVVRAKDNSGDAAAWWNDEGGANEAVPFADLSPAERRNAEARYLREVADYSEYATKFDKYTLPGGENYREVLFTMPQTESLDAKDKIKDVIKNIYNQYAVRLIDGTLFAYPEAKSEQDARELFDEDVSRGRVSVIHAVGSNKDYISPHWPEPNVLAHARINDRVGVKGEKILFIEEIQSDWHQEGRKKGYAEKIELPKINRERFNSASREYGKLVKKTMDELKVSERQAKELSYNTDDFIKDISKKLKLSQDKIEIVNELRAAYKERELAQDELSDQDTRIRQMQMERGRAVPDAPFRKTWHEFVLKRLIRMAAEGGYDKVAWTTGAQQAERYDLSKQIDSIEYKANEFHAGKDGLSKFYTIIVFKDGERVSGIPSDMPVEELGDWVGKEIAQKIVNKEGQSLRDLYEIAKDIQTYVVDGKTKKIERDSWVIRDVKSKVVGGRFATKALAQKWIDHHTPDVYRLSGLDLKVGGEGMKGFYDQIIPAFLNKFGKKWGARVEETDIKQKIAYKFISTADAAKALKSGKEVYAETSDGGEYPIETNKDITKAFDEGSKLFLNEEGDSPEKVQSLELTPALKTAAINEGFSLFQAPPFYHNLQKTLELKMPNVATVDQIRGIIRDQKQEEIKWSGIESFLQEQEAGGKVVGYRGGPESAMPKGKTAQDVIGYETKELGNKIEVVPGVDLKAIKSDDLVWLTTDRTSAAEYGHTERREYLGARVIARESDSGILVDTAAQKNNAPVKINKADLLFYLKANELEIKEDFRAGGSQGSGYRINEVSDNEFEVINNEDDSLVDTFDSIGDARDYIASVGETENDMSESEFAKWTLPGGNNYREMIFSLPNLTIPGLDLSAWNKYGEKFDKDGVRGFVTAVRKKILSLKDAKKIITDGIKNAGIGEEDAHNAIEALSMHYWQDAITYLKDSASAVKYRGSHFGDENVFLHVRANDRIDANGKKMFFIEEIQSDWHQQGRKEGYRGELDAYGKYEAELYKKYNIDPKKDKDRSKLLDVITTEEDQKLDTLSPGGDMVPDAPFKKTWHEFALKRLIRYAAENGYDELGWTTGDQQNERYDLSKQVKEIRYHKADNGLFLVSVKDMRDREVEGIPEQMEVNELEKWVGKDIAQKIIEGKGVEAKKHIYKLDDGGVDARGGNAVTVMMKREGTQDEWSGLKVFSSVSKAKNFLEELRAGEVKDRVLSGLDLKVGGEGMKGFYDVMIPAFLNKFGKKYQAQVFEGKVDMAGTIKDKPIIMSIKEGSQWLRHGGEIWFEETEDRGMFTSFESVEDWEYNFEGMDENEISSELADREFHKIDPKDTEKKDLRAVHAFPITPGLKIAAINEGFSLFQADQPVEPRGATEFTPAGPIIKLFKTADPSTFIHEIAHVWLKDFYDDARSGVLNEKYMNDWKILADWLGVEEGQRVLTREQHEKFAAGWERYLMEGVSPNEELKGAFALFRRWLTKIYKDIRGLNVDISDKVRGVMDRMLASEDEINTARQRAGITEMDLSGFSKETQAQIKALQDQAREMAVAVLLGKQMEELRASRLTETEKYHEKVVKITKERVKGQEEYVVMAAIEKEFKKRAAKEIAHKYVNGQLTSKQSQLFNTIAEMNGYMSGGEMADVVIKVPALDDAVKQAVDAEMVKYAAMKDTDQIKEEAIEAIHNDRQMELLILEKLALQGTLKAVNAPRSRALALAMQIRAAEMLSQKPMKEATAYLPYFTAERNAAQKVGAALANGDKEKAAQHKQEQILNHALAREALKLRKRADKWMRYLHDVVGKEKTAFKKEEHFMQIAALLSRFGLSRDDYVAEDRAETLQQWSDRMNQVTNTVNLAEWLYDESFSKNYKALPMEMLGDLVNAIRNISFIANFENKAFAIAKDVELDTIIKELVDAADKNTPKDKKHYPTPESGRFEGARKIAAQYGFSIKKIGTVLRQLDGWKDGGPWQKYIWNSVYTAANNESSWSINMRDGIIKLWEVYSKEERDEMNKEKFYPELGASVRKMRLLVMAMNLGAEANRDKLFNNRPVWLKADLAWDEMVVMNLLEKNLTKKDWEFVQNTLNLINSIWPDVAAMHKEVTGFEPEKVTAVPFTVKTADGAVVDMAGGYFPLKKDYRGSYKANIEAELDQPLYEEFNPGWKAMTKQGHTKSRTKAQYPLALNITTINQHLRDVIHDLTFRPLVIDFNRLISDKRVVDALKINLGEEGFDMVHQWMQAVAYGNTREKAIQNVFENVIDVMRRKATVAQLFLRPSVFMQNLANIELYSGAIDGFGRGEVYRGIMLRGLFDYIPKVLFSWGEAQKIRDFVTSKSLYMKDRMQSPDYSLMDVHNTVFGKDSRLVEFAIGLMVQTDNMTAIPMWLEAYNQEMNKSGDEEKAVLRADMLIDRTIGGGRKYDAPSIMRGTAMQRAFAMFYSFWNTELNRWMSESGMAGKPGVKNKARFLGFVAGRVLIFNVLSLLLAGKWPNDDEEPWKWWMKQSIAYPMSFFPVIRDVGMPIVDKALGLRSFGYRPSPVTGVIEDTIRAADTGIQFMSGDKDFMDLMERGADVAAYMWPYPQMVNDLFFNAYDMVINGMEPSIEDVYRRRPAKER